MRSRVPWLVGAAVLLLTGAAAAAGAWVPRFLIDPDPAGTAMTLVGAPFDREHPFFQSLGTNGRRCVTCHTPRGGWSLAPSDVARVFAATRGLDPLFRTNDGSTSPTADVSTLEARRVAYDLLLRKGLIRIGRPMPAGAEFELAGVDDPYGFASEAELSLFRRPLPSTNLAFLTTVMWDGRETFTGESIHADLVGQARGATVGHAQGEAPAPDVLERIVDFEEALFTAQSIDRAAGVLAPGGARGAVKALAAQPFYFGINSSQDPQGIPPTTRAFTLFDAWASAVGPRSAVRQSIARGQEIFNTRPFAGRFTCTGCHNAPNAGSNSLALMFDLGISDEARRTPDLPLYTFVCTSGPRAGTTVRSTDPGLALTTGRCADIGRFKVPTLRGLAAHAPYFHDGSAPTLEAVVDFYDVRFGIGLTDVDKQDLVAFLRAL